MNVLIQKTIIAILLGLIAGVVDGDAATGIVVGIILLLAFWVPVYKRYAADNPKHYWFKRKLFGWGWTPVTWQGWLSIGIYLLLVFIFASTVQEDSSLEEIILMFLLPIAALTVLMIRIAYTHGEKPKWQWGKNIDKYTK